MTSVPQKVRISSRKNLRALRGCSALPNADYFISNTLFYTIKDDGFRVLDILERWTRVSAVRVLEQCTSVTMKLKLMLQRFSSRIDHLVLGIFRYPAECTGGL